ncbi:S-adenosyl-L-methionine-dependent methyltransferase [Massarina eburnea CBS 473.64]|uniref:S-adenosyl-L-methionine-dependent methyltransferase n=1 Tax=Massarina eburnea CBS 473.64 TaxID=1395130 RepID=A0A6A6S469_9PLEO|nr:S-adenosyl-L-methionine-dependent methyltransferase [Massarina eburnea CBS 473.64]
MADTEELAQGYTRLNKTQVGAGAFLIEKLGIDPGMQVLDVGCGPGDITSHLADLVGEKGGVVGIDPSKERVTLALQRATSNLSFQVGKAEDLSQFSTASFDAVFVNSTLHWVQDQPAAIKEFARVLKPGGRLGISGGSGDYLTHQERIKADILSREPYKQYPEDAPPKFLKQKEMDRLLDDAELFNKIFFVNKIVKATKDADEMIDWLDTSSSGKTYGGIPMEIRPRAREEMKVEWNKLVTDSGIHMDMELLVTVAYKG